MPSISHHHRTERLKPLLLSLSLLVSATVALSSCQSTKGKDAMAELLTPDEQSVAASAPGSAKAYKDTLVDAASPSPEYQTAAAATLGQPAPPAADGATAAGRPQTGNVVMQATGINANRSSIFSMAPQPQVAAPLPEGAEPATAAPAAPASGGINATNSSVFSTSGKNPLLSSQADSKGSGGALAYMEEDDIPLIMRGKLYSSRDLGPDPNDTASDMVSLASLPSMTRQSVTGLIVQNPRVQTSCFKPRLLAMLHDAERHFGKKIVVTSGFRDPEHNLAVGGAKHSMHLSCDAADIQMVGISKWDLARYFRARDDIGGVGTYCSTNSIHVDIGRRRDWNWKCRADAEL